MDNNVDEEKVVEIYQEAIKIVRKGTRLGETQSEILKALEEKIRKVIDDEN